MNSHDAWPGEGATRVPYFVYEDADLYEAKQKLIFRGPVWNYLGLEVQMPSTAITPPVVRRHAGIVVSNAEGRINALVNRCAHKGPMICYQPSGHVSELTCPYLKSAGMPPCPSTLSGRRHSSVCRQNHSPETSVKTQRDPHTI